MARIAVVLHLFFLISSLNAQIGDVIENPLIVRTTLPTGQLPSGYTVHPSISSERPVGCGCGRTKNEAEKRTTASPENLSITIPTTQPVLSEWSETPKPVDNVTTSITEPSIVKSDAKRRAVVIPAAEATATPLVPTTKKTDLNRTKKRKGSGAKKSWKTALPAKEALADTANKKQKSDQFVSPLCLGTAGQLENFIRRIAISMQLEELPLQRPPMRARRTVVRKLVAGPRQRQLEKVAENRGSSCPVKT